MYHILYIYKLLNTNANIYFKRICLEKNITPQYAQVKIHSCNESIKKHIEPKINKIRIKNEIKFLYAKKKTLNETLYKIHLQVINEWGKTCNIINQYITQKRNKKIEIKYKPIHNKIKKLTNMTQNNKTPNTFYKRT
jgi:hypothetical protein